MSFCRRIFNDYFDDGVSISDDSDSYDEKNEISNPTNPVWDGSEIHTNPYGTDPTAPDPNEVNPD
ncbi:MAG: hypothetical protein ONB44_00005 [candidate division KSB1 bacterium]|nr:hypothetical protein [candidate division KSB1 bacterium]MDZ7300504.1 hypothetical protein [candidate division KSB1 bacterium]MDZ7309643.1 hypothetical protein [candidate division KSB1 bacterium]